MFKNDRMMTMLTGLVLAVFAGTMVQYGDRFMAMISGETQIQTSDDFYSVRSGATQVLDILSNDQEVGPIVVIAQPRCGVVALSGSERLQYSSDSSCSGEIVFSYCVDTDEGCATNNVTLNVIAIATTENSQPVTTPVTTPVEQVAQATPAPVEETASEAAPVVVATVTQAAPATQAPAINNDIIVSMQPPRLVAPTIDEFVSPSSAIASIRQQNIVLENTSANTDTSIATQSSAGTVAPVEFGVADFGSTLDSEDNNVLIGGASNTDEQVAVNSSPQLTSVAPSANPVVTQLERGPNALAELPASSNNSFGAFVADDQNGVQLMASVNTDTFDGQIADVSNVIAEVEADQTTLAIEQSGTTALIALQLSGSPLTSTTPDNGTPQLLSPQGEEEFASHQTSPVTLSTSADVGSAVVVLEREPTASTDGPVIADASRLLAAVSSDVFLPNPASALATGPAFMLGATPGADNLPDGQISVASGIILVNASPLDTNEFLDESEIILASIADDGLVRSVLPATDFTAQSVILGGVPQIDTSSPLTIFEYAALRGSPTELASLDTTTTEAPIIVPPVQQLATCEIFLDPSVRSGANILLFLIAECKPNAPVTINHAGLEFTILTDADGTANVVVPALQRTAEITATFADGSSESTVALVTQINDVTRAAVTWSGEVDLDLHAFEYGAITGGDGHVWAGNARDYRSARLKGGGYLVELGDVSIEGGALAEVYTMPLGRSVERGTVTMALEINNGDTVCGDNISVRTLRTRSENDAGSRSIRFAVPSCGNDFGQLSVPGAVEDIRLAAQ